MCDVHLAVNLFVEMATNLLEKCDTGDNFFILSEHVSQDPLENYFGQQRGRGGRCDNAIRGIISLFSASTSVKTRWRTTSDSREAEVVAATIPPCSSVSRTPHLSGCR